MKTGAYHQYLGPGRIGITRTNPRGVPSGYRVEKRLAPGPWFKSVTAQEFCTRYREVLDQIDAAAMWAHLHTMAGDDVEPVLLCYEREPFTRENWCHRRLVAEWFERELGVEVEEAKGWWREWRGRLMMFDTPPEPVDDAGYTPTSAQRFTDAPAYDEGPTPKLETYLGFNPWS